MIETLQQSVLLSIRPKWARLILSGEKTVEVRKNFPAMVTLPFRVFLYETMAETETPWMDEDGHVIFKGSGMVIGEFTCNEIHDIEWRGERYHRPYPEEADQLSEEELRQYLDKASGAGWEVSSGLTAYEKPKALRFFRKPCLNELYCESCAMYNEHDRRCGNEALRITRPPQSWCYAEEAECRGQ